MFNLYISEIYLFGYYSDVIESCKWHTQTIVTNRELHFSKWLDKVILKPTQLSKYKL